MFQFYKLLYSYLNHSLELKCDLNQYLSISKIKKTAAVVYSCQLLNSEKVPVDIFKIKIYTNFFFFFNLRNLIDFIPASRDIAKPGGSERYPS